MDEVHGFGLRLIRELPPTDVHLARGFCLFRGKGDALVCLGRIGRAVLELSKDCGRILTQPHRIQKVRCLLIGHALDGLAHAEKLIR